MFKSNHLLTLFVFKALEIYQNVQHCSWYSIRIVLHAYLSVYMCREDVVSSKSSYPMDKKSDYIVSAILEFILITDDSMNSA